MQNLVQALLDAQNHTGIGGAHFLTGINGVGKTTFLLNLKKDFDQKKIKVSLSSQKPLTTLKHWRVQDLLNYAHSTLEYQIDKKFLEAYSADMGLEKFSSTPVMKLSGGENQVLKIYLCLLMKAHYYFLDEPTTYLDSEKRNKLIQLIQSLKSHGRKFLIIEHDLDFLEKVADHKWMMNQNGDIVLEGEAHDV
jgi:energy-coupling factor transporter ATP-binding protein EcfA2